MKTAIQNRSGRGQSKRAGEQGSPHQLPPTRFLMAIFSLLRTSFKEKHWQLNEIFYFCLIFSKEDLGKKFVYLKSITENT